jgi:hypothetical protein
MAWQSATDTVARFKPRDSNGSNHEKFDLDTIVNLSRWVEDSTGRLGRDRMNSILNILETIGYVNTDLKDLLVKFVNHEDEEAPETTALDYLVVLTELQKLMGRENKSNEISLLYILCKENDNR